MLDKTKPVLTQRSQEKEFIDLGPNYYSHYEYIDCLEKLFRVNKLLGFFYSTKAQLKKFPKESTLLDIGCGGGLFLLNLSNDFPRMSMLGIDICPEAIESAKQALVAWQQKNLASHVSFQLQQEPELASIQSRFDILLITLVFHHVDEDKLISFLQDVYQSAKRAVIINELHRHRLAEWLYACFSPFLFRNRLITHDGLVSIRRGFTHKELKFLLQKAGIVNYKIKWCFPFRWRIILWKEGLLPLNLG